MKLFLGNLRETHYLNFLVGKNVVKKQKIIFLELNIEFLDDLEVSLLNFFGDMLTKIFENISA